MKDNKTQPTSGDVARFLETIDSSKLPDAKMMIELMRDVSGDEPVMWGKSIIGFGKYHYKYATGREGDWMKIGFSPRKAAISLYTSCDASQFSDELAELGTHKTGVGCIYIKKLDDVDMDVLRELLKKAYTKTNDYEAHL